MKQRYLLLYALLFFLLLINLSASAFYINSKDSLLLDKYKNDAKDIIFSNPDSAKSIAFKGLRLSVLNSNEIMQAFFLQLIGVSYDLENNLDSALFYLNESLLIFEENNQLSDKANVLNDMGAAYHFRGNYSLALRYYLKSANLKRTSGNQKGLGSILNNVGLIYRAQKNYEEAATYYRQSLSIKKEENDIPGIAASYMNLASLFYSLKEYDSSVYYSKLSSELFYKLNNEADKAGSDANLAKALLAKGDLISSEKILYESMGPALKTNCKTCLLTIYETLGSVELKKNNFFKADAFFIKGLSIAEESDHAEARLGFLQKLAETAAIQRNFKKAYNYADSFNKFSMVIFNEESQRQINEMNAVYKNAEQKIQIDSLQLQKAKNEISLQKSEKERNLFFLSTLLLLLLGLTVYYAYFLNAKQNKLLKEKNKQIEIALNDKEILLKEIHHRVKNNLQVVSSLLHLQTAYIKDETALDAVKESRNRVHAMSLIHRKLYQEGNLTGIKLPIYIKDLCQNLLESYNLHPDQIILNTDVDDLMIDVEKLIPIGLVINELLANSMKYAFPSGRKGEINVMVKQVEEDLMLRIQDNGVGIPGHLKYENNDSFGYIMISGFIKKMKGKLNVSAENGTIVELIFPFIKKNAYA